MQCGGGAPRRPQSGARSGARSGSAAERRKDRALSLSISLCIYMMCTDIYIYIYIFVSLNFFLRSSNLQDRAQLAHSHDWYIQEYMHTWTHSCARSGSTHPSPWCLSDASRNLQKPLMPSRCFQMSPDASQMLMMMIFKMTMTPVCLDACPMMPLPWCLPNDAYYCMMPRLCNLKHKKNCLASYAWV